MSFKVRALMVLCLGSTIHLSSISTLTKQKIDLQNYFQEYQVEGSFILYDEVQDKFIRHNARRCKALFSPASTFKIPNTLIALEEGLIEDENTLIRWNGEEWQVQAWNQDLSLKDAFRFPVSLASYSWLRRSVKKNISSTCQKCIMEMKILVVAKKILSGWMETCASVRSNRLIF